MEELEVVYRDSRILTYLRKKVDEVSWLVTNIEKLERKIYLQIYKYLSNKGEGRISFARIRYLVDREIGSAKEEHRLQNVIMYSDLAITDDFGESLMYEPPDERTEVYGIVESRESIHSLNGKIAGLASDDFEKIVLTAWSHGERDIDIAKDLAARFNRDISYFKLKVARLKKRCKDKYTVDTLLA